MVALQSLNLPVGVRVPVPQPSLMHKIDAWHKNPLNKRVFVRFENSFLIIFLQMHFPFLSGLYGFEPALSQNRYERISMKLQFN